jgi:DNA polymerase-3 subunit delta'
LPAQDPGGADLLARLSDGCLGWALSAVLDDSPLKQRAERLERLPKVIDGDGGGRLDYALQLATQFSQNRETVTEILGLWLRWWRDLLLIKAGCGGLITNTDLEDTLNSRAGDYSLLQIRDFIASIQAALVQLKQNANPQLVLEVLMLSLPRRGG